MIKPRFGLSLFLLLVFALAGCSPDRGMQPPVSVISPAAALASTGTAAPTLPPEDAYAALTNSIQGNANCALPCWFGVVPGQSKFDTAGNILSRFDSIAVTEFTPRWAYLKVKYPAYYVTTLMYAGQDDLVDHILVNASLSADVNGKMPYADPSFREAWQKYFLPELFTRYGTPEKIFLDTTLTAADPSSSYPYALWAVYPKQGFLIRYDGENTKVGDKIRICPLQSRIKLKLWDPGMSSYEKYMQGDMAMGISLGPQPIESVTDLEVETFYEMFKDAGFDTCFETLASIWPH